MIILTTGNGKGKTTSAIGTAIRACGWGNKVAIVFFDKGGSHYGEENILKFLQQKIYVFRFGLERFDSKSKSFRFENLEGDKDEAKHGLEKIYDLYGSEYFLVIADEIINCMNSGLLDESAVRDIIDGCPTNTHLILTGRNAPKWMIEKADLVSEINEIKHYFKDGVDAIKGIDY